MALRKCEGCDNLFDDKSEKCPNCGKFLEKKHRLRSMGILRLVLVVGIAVTQATGFFQAKQNKSGTGEKSPSVGRTEEENGIDSQIEAHYQNLLSFYEANRLDQASREIEVLKGYGKVDYRDVPLLEKKIAIRRLEEEVKGVPASHASRNLEIYRQLKSLDPDNRRYDEKVSLYAARVGKQKQWERKRIEEGKIREKNDTLAHQKEKDILGEAPF